MNWDNARFFLAVARTGTLRGAAAQLDVDQATVGRRIAALEETLSTTLFLRTPALFVLTPAGEALLGAAETMEQAALSIERRIAGLDDQLAGTIRVATTDSLGKQFVVPAIARLRRAHPGIEIVCVTSAQIANLTRREADVAIRTLRPDAPDLIARKLAQLEVGIDMTLRVNREIGFQVASTHEFPEGGAAVSLDGGSHFYEQEVVKAFHDLTHESSTRSFGRVQFGSAV
ncbi:LysR family transcriptional regulator, partial [Paraburkholderia sp. GAS32]|uniref:LysR family transcriptional regulator n=1 Tax=Paraburkholderia sp. GAS32 TaxID=3035129 RepID=UPI003D1ABB55